MIFLRIGVALVGIWLCWSGVKTEQVKKADGIRQIPLWVRVFWVIVGCVCIAGAAFGQASDRYNC
jgi:hypothetical protein